MKQYKISSHEKIYRTLGKVFCTISGGIVGFVLINPVFAIPGLIVGYLIGYSLVHIIPIKKNC